MYKEEIMKKEYLIENLHCSGCAAKIQYELEKLENIYDVKVDIYKSRLTFFTDKHIEDEVLFLKEINKIADKIEPGTKFKKIDSVEEHDHHHHHHHSDEKISKILMLIGIILFIVGMIMKDGKLKSIILIISYVVAGYDILYGALKNIFKGNFLDENFLMGIATVGALALGEYGEAAGVMIFFKIGEYFQDRALESSRKSIESLMSIKPEFANLKGKNGEIEKVSPKDVKKGDLIVVKVGERVPLDGKVVSGETTVDKTALTGESVPVLVTVGDEILSGSINLTGLIEIRVEKLYENSTVSKIIEMVENAGNKKAETEKFITKFARYYTPIVVGLALFIGLIFPLIFEGGFRLWIQRALIFLVISCPCALVLSIPLTFFSSIGIASKKGILIKGGNYLEGLSNVGAIVFDKTGTLTEGKFSVVEIEVYNGNENDLKRYAKVGELYSNHPIAKAIVRYCDIDIDETLIVGSNERAGYGTETIYDGKKILVGNRKHMINNGIEILERNKDGVYVAYDTILVGRIEVRDSIKSGVKGLVDKLREKGIVSYLLTGDSDKVGKEIGKELGFDEKNICTELLPENKVNLFQDIKNKIENKVIFMGDGINDAPVLAISDIGISMGKGGSDIAIESSDLVLMNDEPEKVLEAIEIGKYNKRVVIENIVLALGIKIVVMILGVLGIANMWLAIFADVGVSLLAVLNAMKILRKKF